MGFRYTVRQLAAGCGVVGFVRNRPDGSVQLVVEGAAQEIDRLLDDVRTTMSRYIRETREGRGDANGEFRDFTIRL